MKAILLFSLALVSCSLYGAMESSVSVPMREHMKYTFGNHKNHPVQKQEEKHYLNGLAPMQEEEIRSRLVQQGYGISHIQLRDIASELVYEVYASNTMKERFKIYMDPTNGSILKTENIK